jgi:predicted peptidase
MKMNRRVFCRTSVASLGGLAAGISFSQEPNQTPAPEVALFEAKTFKSTGGKILPYRLFIPKDYSAQKSYPLVLWLHGAGGRGTDNLKHITGSINLGAIIWAKADSQAKNPCIVVAPQCPDNSQWIKREKVGELPKAELSPEQMRLLLHSIDTIEPSEHLLAAYELIESLQKTLGFDESRIYICGGSMGGSGTWALIAAYPQRFAAAVPLCGPGAVPMASRLTKIAIWAFHGEKDSVVPVELTRRMIEAIKQAGGQPKYTELPGAGHPITDQVFNIPDLLPWIFAQRRKAD